MRRLAGWSASRPRGCWRRRCPGVPPSSPAPYSGASGLLLCFALTGPLVRRVTALAGRFGAPGTLAAVNTARASRRVWATVMTVAVAIAVGMGTSGALQNLVSSLSGGRCRGLGEPAFYLSTSNRDGIPTGPTFGDDVTRGGREGAGRRTWRPPVGRGQRRRARILVQGLAPGLSAPYMHKTDQGRAAADPRRGRHRVVVRGRPKAWGGRSATRWCWPRRPATTGWSCATSSTTSRWIRAAQPSLWHCCRSGSTDRARRSCRSWPTRAPTSIRCARDWTRSRPLFRRATAAVRVFGRGGRACDATVG